MKHVFKATKLGWEKERDGIWFDSDIFSKEEAMAEIKEYQGTTQRGYPYTGYEYDGQRYHDVTYLGEFEDDEVPHNDRELKTSLRRHRCQPFVSAALPGMPVFPRTAMSSKPATKRRLSITPTS